MPSYLTPHRFKKMGFGIDVSELDDVELAALSAQATSWINNHCLVPRLPQLHDFRGGTITREQHQWRYPETPFDIGQRKAYPFHFPIKHVDDFKIKVTNTQYVGIQPADLFINNTLRYVEVVSLALTSAGLFNALIIPNIGLATPVVEIGYEYGWDFFEPGETLQPDDGQTWHAQNQWWYSTAADANGYGGVPVIKVNGTEVTTGRTIDHDEGSVTFDDPLPIDAVVTATYHFKLPSEIQWAAGQIMAWLHAEGEQHARGMAHLQALKIGEVQMTRPAPLRPAPDMAFGDLEILVPEAAALLSTFRFQNVTVR